MWHRKNASGSKGAEAPKDGKPTPETSREMAGQVTTREGSDQAQGEPAVPEGAPVVDQSGAMPGAWRMGLVVTASAFCGGIAVVLWNRRLLTKMREVAPVRREEYRAQQGRLWEDDA